MCKKILTILLSLLPLLQVYGEIEFVAVNWKPLKCQGACIKLLEKEFNKIPGVIEISLNQPQGFALLTYAKGAPFSSVSIKTAMKMVGLSWQNIRLKVRGKVRHNGKSIYLVSDVDHTSFELVNPVIPDLNRQSFQFNQAAQYLRPELSDTLLAAESEDKITVIEGSLFMPERSPELVLTVENLSFPPIPEEK